MINVRDEMERNRDGEMEEEERGGARLNSDQGKNQPPALLLTH